MESYRSSRIARLGAVAAVIAIAPVLLGTAAMSAEAPATAGPGSDVTRIVGPGGVPVVERQVEGDVVIDWLDAPPADAPGDLATGHGDEDDGAHDSRSPEGTTADGGDGGGEPTVVLAAGAAESGGTTGQGFIPISSTARWLPSGYTVRLAGSDGRIEQFRDEFAAAASAATSAGGLPVRLSPSGGGSETPGRGEITIVLAPATCASPAYGCGGPTLQSDRIVAGRVWIDPSALGARPEDRLNLASHELAHTLGLHHYSGSWTDGRQAMHPTLSGITTYREGDRRGLRYMAGGLDRASGALTGLGYAAGQLHVTGTVASGSRVRLELGKTWKDVSATNGKFSAALPAPAGRHRVCARSLDAAAGFQRDMGCSEVSAPGTPFGGLDAVKNSFDHIEVRGWAIDPQTAAPVSVEVRRNGKLIATERADTVRDDIGRAHAHYGPKHGFALEIPGVSGSNDVCVRIVGVGAGGNTDLGCRRVTHSVMPIGHFEATQTDLGLAFHGWALDPNTPAPVNLRVTVDGKVPAAPGLLRANEPRPDVAAKYPGYGPAHGFNQSVALAPGRHDVCLIVVNVGQGADRQLGCTRVQVDTAMALTRRAAPATATSVAQPVDGAVSGVLDGVAPLLGG